MRRAGRQIAAPHLAVDRDAGVGGAEIDAHGVRSDGQGDAGEQEGRECQPCDAETGIEVPEASYRPGRAGRGRMGAWGRNCDISR